MHSSENAAKFNSEFPVPSLPVHPTVLSRNRLAALLRTSPNNVDSRMMFLRAVPPSHTALSIDSSNFLRDYELAHNRILDVVDNASDVMLARCSYFENVRSKHQVEIQAFIQESEPQVAFQQLEKLLLSKTHVTKFAKSVLLRGIL